MLRAVIAALLAVALLAASQPAIERTRVGTAHSRVHDELTSVQIAVQDLLASDDPVPLGTPGAQRTVTLRLPERSWASSGIDQVVLGPRDRAPDRLVWRVRGGRRSTLRVPVDMRTVDGDPLVLGRPGRHRLVLALVRAEGSIAIVVRRQTFKPEGAARRGHAVAVSRGRK